jgi:hypothetical protein
MAVLLSSCSKGNKSEFCGMSNEKIRSIVNKSWIVNDSEFELIYSEFEICTASGNSVCSIFQQKEKKSLLLMTMDFDEKSNKSQDFELVISSFNFNKKNACFIVINTFSYAVPWGVYKFNSILDSSEFIGEYDPRFKMGVKEEELYEILKDYVD